MASQRRRTRPSGKAPRRLQRCIRRLPPRRSKQCVGFELVHHLLGWSRGGECPALPLAPTGAAAACSGLVGGTIKVTWNPVTLTATSYSILESTTSASGGYSVVASSVTGTSWTSPTPSAGNYWFEVAATIGTHWLGPNSSATGESTIAVLSIICSQP